jgi:hypothetical protein
MGIVEISRDFKDSILPEELGLTWLESGLDLRQPGLRERKLHNAGYLAR